MAESPTSLARGLIEGDPGGLEELRIHEFPDDESAHEYERSFGVCNLPTRGDPTGTIRALLEKR